MVISSISFSYRTDEYSYVTREPLVVDEIDGEGEALTLILPAPFADPLTNALSRHFHVDGKQPMSKTFSAHPLGLLASRVTAPEILNPAFRRPPKT